MVINSQWARALNSLPAAASEASAAIPLTWAVPRPTPAAPSPLTPTPPSVFGNRCDHHRRLCLPPLGNGTISTAANITVAALNDVTITSGSNYYAGNKSSTIITGGKLTNDGTFTFQASGNSANIEA